MFYVESKEGQQCLKRRTYKIYNYFTILWLRTKFAFYTSLSPRYCFSYLQSFLELITTFLFTYYKSSTCLFKNYYKKV